MTKSKKIITNLAIISFLIVGISYLEAWTAPTGNPPNNNTDAPLNVGSLGQIKMGPLTVNGGGYNYGLSVPFGAVLIGTSTIPSSLSGSKIAIVDGSQGDGKVLVSNSQGVATWKATSTLGITGGGTSIILTPITCPSGSYVSGQNSNGSVICTPLPSTFSNSPCIWSSMYYGNGSWCQTYVGTISPTGARAYKCTNGTWIDITSAYNNLWGSNVCGAAPVLPTTTCVRNSITYSSGYKCFTSCDRPFGMGVPVTCYYEQCVNGSWINIGASTESGVVCK